MPTEKEIIQQLQKGRISLLPLSLRLLQANNIQVDKDFNVCLEATWGCNTIRFAVEIKSMWTPKVFQNALSILKSSRLPKDYEPMLIMPFLNEKQLLELERQKISGIDLCGNGVVIAPGKFAVVRTGEKNLFSTSAPIKNIYRKNSSMVGRVFLARSFYPTVQDVRQEINRRNPLVKHGDKKPMSLSTVSKALKTLEDDLIVKRDGAIRLLQGDKLLEKLSENYVPPKIKSRARLKVTQAMGAVRDVMLMQTRGSGLPIVASGTSSVTQYAVMQRGEVLSVYCTDLEMLLHVLPHSASDRFPNLELIETEDEVAYFDARQELNFWWASPVQVYLELMAGDKRDRETAEQVKLYIMKNLQSMQP